MKPKWTKGDWSTFIGHTTKTVSICIGKDANGRTPCIVDWPGFDSCGLPFSQIVSNAVLMTHSPKLYAEMERYLPILEKLEANPKLWAEFTEGTGIATLNGYKNAMSLARNEITPNS
jgi:hypothetical protein